MISVSIKIMVLISSSIIVQPNLYFRLRPDKFSRSLAAQKLNVTSLGLSDPPADLINQTDQR